MCSFFMSIHFQKIGTVRRPNPIQSTTVTRSTNTATVKKEIPVKTTKIASAISRRSEEPAAQKIASKPITSSVTNLNSKLFYFSLFTSVLSYSRKKTTFRVRTSRSCNWYSEWRGECKKVDERKTGTNVFPE